jgi:hypothetical protein
VRRGKAYRSWTDAGRKGAEPVQGNPPQIKGTPSNSGIKLQKVTSFLESEYKEMDSERRP